MITVSLTQLFDRELDKLKSEIEAFDETKLWMLQGDISNTAGNLCLHLCGNLQHFIGAILGKSGYIRQRDKEFEDKDIAKSILYEQIETSKTIVRQTLEQLSPEQLESDYPEEIRGQNMNTTLFLLHLFSHLCYHIGQINYCRRLL